MNTTLAQSRNATTSAKPRSKILVTFLWIVQVLLAFGFGMFGFMKLTQPIAALVPMMPWTKDVPEAMVRFIGLSEVLGAIGILFPSLTRILPRLTPLAGAGLVLVTAMALVFHLSRGEMGAMPTPLILGSLSLFVAWGRFRKAPIEAR